jgi:flagellar basal-body rod protein FlgB
MADINRHIGVYSNALNLRAQRHQILASNIANADTPQYKARDFDFSAAMERAMSGSKTGGGLSMATTARGHLPGSGDTGPAHLQFRQETQSAVDGNTVDMDVERAQIAENAIQYQVLTQLISDKFKGLRGAMAGTQG